MAGHIQLPYFGGTLLMKQGADGATAFYSIEDVMLTEILRAQGQEELRQDLLKHGHGFPGDSETYARIGQVLSGRDASETAGNFTDQRSHENKNHSYATETARQHRARLGLGEVRRLEYAPIDSINFDVDTHYPSLRQQVLKTIAMGDVPVIMGGTDTLRYYGTLLQEDLQQLHRDGLLPHVPPVLIASSMLVFGDTRRGTEQQHVYRLLKAAPIAAREAVKQGKSGVFALLPNDEQVSSVALLDLGQACDKISGKLVKAFVGTTVPGLDRIDPDQEFPGSVYDAGDPRLTENARVAKLAESQHYVEMRNGRAAYLSKPPDVPHRLVAPPLEASNSLRQVGVFLAQLNRTQKTEARAPFIEQAWHFDTVVVKYPLAGNAMDGLETVAKDIATLRKKGTDVVFLRDPVADMQGKLITPKEPRDPAWQKARRELESAGAMFVEGMTSTQAVVRAQLLDKNGQPAWFTKERAAAETAAALYQPKQARGIMPERGSRVAIEYIPDAKAYALAIDALDQPGMEAVVSVNCTDGALAECHAKTLGGVQHLKSLFCSFKYAGRSWPGMRGLETASLSSYAPAVAMAEQAIVKPGGITAPEQHMHGLQRLY